jgi:thiamine pyrophosphate-dependent acetolactate synthase large subunit-like protein
VGAGDALGRLATATGALTGTTALGRGLFPDPSTDLGVVGGFGRPDAMALIHDADVVVAFGASLNQFTMRFGHLVGPDTVLAQVDVEAAPTHPRVDVFARADARMAAEALADLLEERRRTGSGWPDAAARGGRHDPGEEAAPDGRLDPRSLARSLAALLPEDRVVVCDGGHFLGWSNMYWPVASPDRMVMVGTAYQSIGLGWPSVVGAARAKPRSTVVLNTGDGGGLMALADLESAVRVAGGRGIAVVWNDAAYGAEVNLYGLKGLAQAPMRIPEVDFAALAAAVGAEGVTVTRLDDLERLRGWSSEPEESRRFLVLDCRISPDVVAPYQREVIAAHG